jgi:hypothetical protein
MVERIGLAATMDTKQFDAGMQKYISGVVGMATTSEKSGSRAQNALNTALTSVESGLNKTLDAQKRYRLELEVGAAAYKKAAETGTASAAQLQLQQMHLDSLRAKLQETGAQVEQFATAQQKLGIELEKVNASATSFTGKAAAGIGSVLKGISEGVGGAISGIGKVGSAVTSFLGPIGKIGSIAINAFSTVGKAATGILGGAFSGVSKIASTVFGGLGKIVSGLIPHFGRARDEMDGLGQQGQRTGGILQTALGVALGNVITGALNNVINMVKGLVGELFNLGNAFQMVSAYERMTQTMGAMTGMELRRSTQVEKILGTTTARINLTEKEVAALEKAKDAYRKNSNDLAIQQRAYEAMAASGTKSAEEMDNMALKIDQTQRKVQEAGFTIDSLSSAS